MEKILICSGSAAAAKALGDMLGEREKPSITVTTNSGEARRLISAKTFDLIIINSPLADDLGADFAIDAAGQCMAAILFIVKSDIYGMLAQRLESYGVMVLDKPLNKAVFLKSLSLSRAMLNRLRGFRQENQRLKNRIAEMRITDRAKSVLMEYLKLSEPQAHKFIVKQAMDMRMTKLEVAQNILKTYEK